MSNLIIVRHGKTEINRMNEGPKEQHIFGGQIDAPLLKEGEEGAIQAGRDIASMEEMQIQLAVSSDLERAMRTRQLILEQLPGTIPIHTSEYLRERSLGEFEGMLKTDAMHSHPQYFSDPNLKRFREDFQQKAPGGENFTEVTERVRTEMEKIFENQSGDILLVCHIHAIRCLLHWMLDLSEEKTLSLTIPNTTPIIMRRGQNPEIIGEVNLEKLIKDRQ